MNLILVHIILGFVKLDLWFINIPRKGLFKLSLLSNQVQNLLELVLFN